MGTTDEANAPFLSTPLRVALVAIAIALIVAAYWFVSQRTGEALSVESGGSIERGGTTASAEAPEPEERSTVERILAATRPADETPADETPTAETAEPSASSESLASSLAAGQAPDGEADAGREVASIEEVTLDLGDGQEARLRSGSGGTLAIRELSALDGDVSDVLGARITLVSLSEPGLLMLEDGSRFNPGARMPSGHVVSAIERERIVLERDGLVSVIRLP